MSMASARARAKLQFNLKLVRAAQKMRVHFPVGLDRHEMRMGSDVAQIRAGSGANLYGDRRRAPQDNRTFGACTRRAREAATR